MIAKPRNSKENLSFEPLDVTEYRAKTWLMESGAVVPGRTLVDHSLIVGAVCSELVSRMNPEVARRLFPCSPALLAACHDIGKLSPYFVEKLRRALTAGKLGAGSFENINPVDERNWGGHAGVSQLALLNLDVPANLPEIVGQHHGYSPSIEGLDINDEVFGGNVWQQQRNEFLNLLKQSLGSAWPSAETAAHCRVLAGLTTVSDWIGSGSYFEDPSKDWRPLVARAVDSAGFFPVRVVADLSFEGVFGFSARPSQTAFMENVREPGVYVLEAPTGSGKTEAALYSAYRILCESKAQGIYFALPTQITSNKIWERLKRFLEAILPPGTAHYAKLVHSNAWLVEADLGSDAAPGGSWFSAAKRGVLAPFAVGTVDQALMAAINVKHGFVRAFGLAGKVVILDEVHTYDCYTGTLIDELVRLLRELGCTVIILSATLSKSRRKELLGNSGESDAYPLLSGVDQNNCIFEMPLTSLATKTINLCLVEAVSIAVEETLRRAENGQSVLWIENTVQDAQEIFRSLAARASEIGLECGLLHSRFTFGDRAAKEQRWVKSFGKEGWKERSSGRILIGTQVLEQSLDIDADFLVSRFAPTDMLFQRLGRLWRHAGTPRDASASCDCWLLAPCLDQAVRHPVAAFGKSAAVYDPYVLCRSLEVWQFYKRLCVPNDVRSLIERTYSERVEDGLMAKWLYQLEEGTTQRIGRRTLRSLAHSAIGQAGKTLPECKAQTRLGDGEHVQVLLLRSMVPDSKRRVTRMRCLDETVVEVPWDRYVLGKQAWRKLSAALAQHFLNVPLFHAPQAVPSCHLTKLGVHHVAYLGRTDRQEALLRVGIVEKGGFICGLDGQPAHPDFSLSYRVDVGYRAVKEVS